MSKRRISKQQSIRIAKIQERYCNDTTSNVPGNHQGLVIARHSKRAEVETAEGTIIQCAIRPNIDSLVTGDRVTWQISSHNNAVIVSRFPRHSVLRRTDERHEKIVAANLTQLIIVVAVKPEISWLLLDSYLLLAESLGLKVIILLNKTDLPCNDIKLRLEYYEALQYQLFFLSNKHPESYQQLDSILAEEVSVIVGQSGVGKSSIINQILPQLSIAISAISTNSELGCHTTSHSRYYHLPKGGALIDSPGVREFGLQHMTKAEVLYGYPEFRLLASECKFRNCDHVISPGCALLAAVTEKKQLAERYQTFIKLFGNSR